MSNESINLKKLSENLGLSQTTVSRALNGFPEVAERTRARVLAAAEQLNYRPSPSAATLATGKSWAIGHVVPLSDHRMINPHFTDFISGAGEIYANRGYDFLMRVVAQEEEEKVYRDFASRRRVDGVVVHGPLSIDPRIDLLQDLGLPFVVHGRSDGEAHDYSWLDVNNKSAFTRATELLIDLGHERIGLLNGLETMNFAKRRRHGYEAAMLKNGLKIDPGLIFAEDMVEPYGYRTTSRLLESDNPPTALLASSILVALGIGRAANDRGLMLGRDLSVIAFDDCLSFLNTAGALEQPPYFTSMRSSIREAGKRVAELLIDQIDQKPEEPVHELWEAQLVIGETTGPNRHASRNYVSGRVEADQPSKR